MVKRLVHSIIILLPVLAAAQTTDTLYLEAVEVSEVSRYTHSGLGDKLDSIVLSPHSSAAIGDVLQNSTGAYIKQYGAEGQLSSITLRGTTSSQTRLSWQGIDINSQTLGQSDFSSTPTFLFSEITVHQGANSALFGSGSIGGTVELKSEVAQKGVHMELQQEFGSFGKRFTGVKASVGKRSHGLSVAAVNSVVQNDFEVDFRNETYRQNNAASDLKAVKLSGFYRMEGGGRISADLWYNDHFREVQPILGDRNGDDQLQNSNWRTYLAYDRPVALGYFKSGFAFIADRQTYNESAPTNLDRLVWDGHYEHFGFSKLTIRAGATAELALPDVAAYTAGINLWRFSPHVFSQFKPMNEFTVLANLRVPYQSNQPFTPIVPSVGFSYNLLETAKQALKVNAEVARAFRFPTLNDLYWQPGGNLALLPEDGISGETGITTHVDLSTFRIGYEVQYYRSWLDQMIVWLPKDGVWSPENAQNVNIQGVEQSLSVLWQKEALEAGLFTSYTYNESINQDGFDGNTSSVGKQLPYVPLHKWNARVHVRRGGWGLDLRASHTGSRYTETSNTSELAAFTCYDLHLSRELRIDRHQLVVQASVKNLLDADYQNYELRATPGRNFHLKLNYTFN